MFDVAVLLSAEMSDTDRKLLKNQRYVVFRRGKGTLDIEARKEPGRGRKRTIYS